MIYLRYAHQGAIFAQKVFTQQPENDLRKLNEQT